MKKNRYFIKTPHGGNTVFYKLQEDNEAKSIKELVLKDKTWHKTDNLIHMLISGNMDLDEITESEFLQINKIHKTEIN